MNYSIHTANILPHQRLYSADMLRIYVKMLRSHTFTATYVCGITCFVFFAVCVDLGGRVEE